MVTHSQVLAEHIGEYMLYDEPFNRNIACPKPQPTPWLLRVYQLLYASSPPSRKSWWPAWLTLRLPSNWTTEHVHMLRKVVHTRWAALQLPKLWTSAADKTSSTSGRSGLRERADGDERAEPTGAAPSREVAQRSCEVSCDASGAGGGAGGGCDCGDSGGGDGSGGGAGSNASLVSQLWTRALGGLCLSTVLPNPSPSAASTSSSADDETREVEPKNLEAEAANECYVDLSSVQRWLGHNARPWLQKAGLALFYILRLLALTTVMLVAAVRVRGVITERRRTDAVSTASASTSTASTSPAPPPPTKPNIVGNGGMLTAAAATGKGKKEKGSGKGGNGGNGVVGKPCATCTGQPRGALLLPCGHTCLCFACATHVAAANGPCPTCACKVLTVHKAHLDS